MMVMFIVLFYCVVELLATDNNCSRSGDKELSSWSQWSLCSKSCGTEGTRMRYRFCSSKLQKNCIDRGVDVQNETCNHFRCPSFDDFYHNEAWHTCLFFTPTHGNWSAWHKIGNCSIVTCQVSISVRYCNNPKPMHCGNHCGTNNFLIENCEAEFLPFSKINKLSSGDDFYTSIQFPSQFTLMGSSNLYFSSNGIVSIKEDRQFSTPFVVSNHDRGVVFLYYLDLHVKDTSRVYYNNQTDTTVLDKINVLVNSRTGTRFKAKTVLTVTYADIVKLGTNLKLSFQGTLASNGTNTYGIFIYKRLEAVGGFVGYYDKSCGNKPKSFLDTSNNNTVVDGSNVQIPGVYVYELSCN